MRQDFQKLLIQKELVKTRFIFVAAFLCSYIFYYFMVRLSPEGKDYLLGRDLIGVISAIGLLVSFRFKEDMRWTRFFVNLVSVSYFAVYLYLGHINHWTVFYRWSYAVVTAIICAIAMSWTDFVVLATVAMVASIIDCAFSPMSLLEQIHFHAANLTMFFVIGFNVHSNYKYQKALYQASLELIETSKMTALGRMAGGVAHEINNPLAIIQMNAELLRIHLKSDSPASGSLEIARGAAQKIAATVDRISSTVKGLLAISRSSPIGGESHVNLGTVFTHTRELCIEKLKKSEVALVLPDAEHIEVKAQEGLLIQVFLNLINNAFDAVVGLKKKEIQIDVKPLTSERLRIRFCDSGPGVASDVVPYLMEPFFTTKPVGKGSGLGLSISRGIIESYGGKLYYDPNAGGSCFTIELPYRRR
jgi:signal transduction histidine kinase